jgi:hypothetical protein
MAEERNVMTPDMQMVVDRLEKVEKQNRRLKVMGVILIAVVGVLVLTGVTFDDPVIGAEAFTLVGEKGEPRAVFAMVNSEPTLAFFDNAGRVRAGVSVVNNSPQIALYDETGTAIWTAPPPGGPLGGTR